MNRQARYLNVILTINALLLGSLLWTQVADRPLLVREAEAQGTPGIPNAAAQRERMIDAINDLERVVTHTNSIIEGGKLSVTVSNLGDLKVEPKE